MRSALLPLLAPLRERALYAALAGGLLLWALAYQAQYRPFFAIGGDAATGRRHDDAPFLLGVNDPEPDRKGVADWRTLPPGYGYRWASSDAAIQLPGLGGGAWQLELGAASGRPGASVPSTWVAADKRSLLEIGPVIERPRRYRVLAPADGGGDVTLRMLTPRHVTADPRDLGFVLTSLRATPAGGGPSFPALPQLGWLALALALAHVQLRAAGLKASHTFAASAALAAAAALVLATARLALTSFTPALAAVLAGCLALTAALRVVSFARLTAVLGHQPRDHQGFLAAVIGIVALAWGLRLGGMLHPQYLNSDVLFNAHKLLSFQLGNVYQTAGLPAETGGGDAPYPPGVYVTLAPLQLFFAPNDDGLVPLLKVGVALLDSLVAGLIGLALWRSVGARAGLLGAALYAAPPPPLLSFSVGEFANIGGQALAIGSLAALALAGQRAKGEGPSGAGLRSLPPATLCLLLCASLMAHLGAAISLGCALAGLWLVRLAAGLCGARWRPLAQLTLIGALAAAAVAALYYSAPPFLPLLAARLAGGAGGIAAPTDETALGRVLGSLGSVIAWRGKIVPPLALAGALGLALLLVRRRPAPVGALAAGWWLGTLLSLGLLAVARQGVRWDLFFYPALCLCGGAALDALWRRGRAGRAAALAATVFPLCYGVIFWVAQVRDNYH